MSNIFSESSYENAVIGLFKDKLEYDYLYGPNVNRDYNSPICSEILKENLKKINNQLPVNAIDEAIFKLTNFDIGTLVQKNKIFMDYLQNGVEVSYYDGKEDIFDIVYLIDYQNVENNSFIIANQWTIVENSQKRPDILVFVNGLPLALFELKSPSREESDASAAYRQIKNYMKEIPSVFLYNAICVMSDMSISKAGTITSNEDRYMEWKTTDGSYDNTQFATFETFFEGIFDKTRFLDIIRNFICYNIDNENTFKILAGYHQYFAVKKAITTAVNAVVTDGKGGVFWHTQGSGKSLSMVFYAKYLQRKLDSPTIVVITDRNDLDDQLYGQFSRCSDFLRQTPIQAEDREHLKKLLIGRESNGIIFTTMQKFSEREEALSLRKNIVVIADEAHRSQYGLNEKTILTVNEDGEAVAKTIVGAARIIRNNLPNATYIGFTGTPISSKDRSTREVFGEYIDVYDMTQAVEDGATRPIYYESRVIHLKLDQKTIEKIDEKYDELSKIADEYVIEKSKRHLGQLDAILGHDQTLNSLVDDILKHYEENREHYLTGKAMVVAYSRPVAMKIYRKLLEKRPNWTKKLGIVMTSGNDDPEEWYDIIGGKQRKDEMARKFKDNESDLKIVIVVDMWLTGFDVPSLSTMYVYKPMSGHNLMQAIARVNRVFLDKEGGLIVDYVGIAKALKTAMRDYTNRDKNKFGDADIATQAYPKFLEKLSICQDYMHGFDYSNFGNVDDYKKAQLINGGTNHMLRNEAKEAQLEDKLKTKNKFIKEALLLKHALSLCSSIVSKENRYEAAYFETVRTMLVKLASAGASEKLNLNKVNETINELLKHSIKSEGVINLFSDIKEGFSIFDPKFLEEISKLKEKNLALELLKKLINEQVKVYTKTNLVKSEKFSSIIKSSMNRYLNGMITNEEVIQELLKLAKDIALASEEANELGLTKDELAFYDALVKPQAIKDFINNDQLVQLTKELTEALNTNRTIDWQKKETARAGMRRIVKRLLRKYDYPPKECEGAVETVISQCELWVDNYEFD